MVVQVLASNFWWLWVVYYNSYVVYRAEELTIVCLPVNRALFKPKSLKLQEF